MKKLSFTGTFKIILPIITIFIFSQCMHDEYDFDKLDDEMEFVAGVLAPVAYGSLGLDDIISELDSTGFISTDADGLLLLTYEDSLFSFIADDLLQIPSQNFVQVSLGSPITIPPGGIPATVNFTERQTYPFIFNNNESLDSMILDQGNFVFNITSDFLHTGSITITCQNIRLNNTPFTQTVTINDPSGGFVFNTPFSLDGYTVYLTDSVTVDSTFGYISVDFDIELINSGAGITAGERIAIDASLESLNFEAIFGYIGDYELLSQTGDLDLGFFDSPLDGFIEFAEPELNFNIRNSYGLPAEVDISRFVGFKGTDDSLALTLDATVNPFRYAFPKLADYINSDINKDTVISINAGNSSIANFLAFLPSRLEFNMNATSNPDTTASPYYNFVTDESRIDVDVEFILPLFFKADSFALEDTIDLDLQDIDEDADFIESVNVMLEVANGLPLDIDFQLYFLDSLYNPVDTLFAEGSRPVISSGTIDPVTYEVIAPGVKTSLVEYTNQEIIGLKTVRYGLIRAGLKTPDDSNGDLVAVKFFTNYNVDFDLSLGVNVRANTNDF